MLIRLATVADTEALLDIYTPYVRNTAITFEYEIPTVEDFSNRIRTILEKFPYLIAEEDGHILGYAYASAFKTRAAYDWSVETSIYIDLNLHHKGIGKALYQALEEYLKKQNVCNLCACISYPNPQSISFHEALGYRTVAHFTKSGYKTGTWYDMVWMEKFLCKHTTPPSPFIPFKELSASLEK